MIISQLKKKLIFLLLFGSNLLRVFIYLRNVIKYSKLFLIHKVYSNLTDIYIFQNTTDTT